MSAPSFLRRFAPLEKTRGLLLVPEGVYPFEQRTENGIRIGYGWYIYRGEQSEFYEHLERSEAHLLGVLDEVRAVHPIDAERTVVLGYSQGGYLAGFLALRHPDRFRGMVLAATRLKHEFLRSELRHGTLPQALFVHSTADPAIPWAIAKQSIDLFEKSGGDAETYLHSEGHRFGSEAVVAIKDWLLRKNFTEDVERNGPPD